MVQRIKNEIGLAFAVGMFLTGCVLGLCGCFNAKYGHEKFDPATGRLVERVTAEENQCLINSDKSFIVDLPDGSSLTVSKSELVVDSNSLEKITEGVTRGVIEGVKAL